MIFGSILQSNLYNIILPIAWPAACVTSFFQSDSHSPAFVGLITSLFGDIEPRKRDPIDLSKVVLPKPPEVASKDYGLFCSPFLPLITTHTILNNSANQFYILFHQADKRCHFLSYFFLGFPNFSLFLWILVHMFFSICHHNNHTFSIPLSVHSYLHTIDLRSEQFFLKVIFNLGGF